MAIAAAANNWRWWGERVLRKCAKCGANIQLQQGRGRRRSMCVTCSPPRNRGTSKAASVTALSPTSDEAVARSVVDSITRELREAGMLSSHQGQCALLLAERIEVGEDTGAALAQLVRQLRETMASALASAAPAEVDPLDELRAKRERRGS